MFKISTKVTGDFDLGIDKQWVEISCPQCLLEESVQIKDLLNEKLIICRGCKILIRPVDEWDDAKRQIKKINEQFKNIFKGF
ncbi:hypothetical protein BMS_0781 [Halobacteriovorax marinus SJ]|uniref:Uncharacterized protein n=1 Tax=Halobacteriovorax marinus (strain ATCC BAA-682 / DSM 15412 / SJ) TaxID=862908 RepID=E1X5W6_HALMS|nr:hypothetical protein [Halobacteriovorax marinus]CBW25683.1 hypothetical protein BMS_0781 [Halobacteriovorax marinus SJ]